MLALACILFYFLHERRNNMAKKIIGVGLILIMLLAVSIGVMGAELPQGTGTAADPFLIYDEAGLKSIPQKGLGKSYKLMEDINLTANWAPIGTSSEKFTGTFDGNGHAISNLNINTPTASMVGLFGYVSNADIRNLGIESGPILGKGDVGALVGYADGTKIIGCYSKANVACNENYAGGLVGSAGNYTVISQCYTKGKVTTGTYIGGIAGGIRTGTRVENCYSTGKVGQLLTSGGYTGGITGIASDLAIIEKCYAAGNVYGNIYAGGVSGMGGAIKNSVASNMEIKISYNGNSPTNRITGNQNAAMSNNISYQDMAVKYNGFATRDFTINNTTDGVGRTATQLQQKETYEALGWNFSDIWEMNTTISEFPILKAIPTQTQKVDLRYGTRENPYLIMNENDLRSINSKSLDAHYKLMEDITLTADWTPISTFTGSFDGNGHTISNLNINTPTASMVGLFGYVSNADIRNLGIESGTILGKGDVGALVGYADGTKIIGCYSKANVACNGNYAGGLVGSAGNYTVISQCYTKGKVTTGTYIGGIVGGITSGTKIEDCYATGNVGQLLTSVGYTGGIVGIASNLDIEKCYASGNIYGNIYAGGISGMRGAIKNSVASNMEVKVNYGYGNNTSNRVTGNANAPMSNNIAYENMLVMFGGRVESIKAMNPSADSVDGKNATMAQLETQSTYENLGWDFEKIWMMGEKYPILRLEAFNKTIPEKSNSINNSTMGTEDYQFTFSEGWGYKEQQSAYAGDESYSNAPDSYFQMKFKGSQSKWYGALNNTCGMADIYIDGILIKTVDCYSPTRVDNQLLFDSGKLTKGQHVLKVVISNEKNENTIERYITADRIEVETSDVIVEPMTINDDFIGTGKYQFSYSDAWAYHPSANTYKGDETYTNIPEAAMEMSFNGTRAKWYGVMGENCGIASVYVDGAFVKNVDCYNPSRKDGQMLFDSGVLPQGAHNLKIVLLDEKNSAATDRYITVDKMEIFSDEDIQIVATINDNFKGIKNYQINDFNNWAYHEQIGAYDNDETYANTAGNEFMVKFEGKQVKWYGVIAENCGMAEVYIDGILVKNVDCYNQARKDDVVLFESEALSQGLHELKVVISTNKNPNATNTYITVDRIDVIK